jgi:hypothetical protein
MSSWRQFAVNIGAIEPWIEISTENADRMARRAPAFTPGFRSALGSPG